MNYKTRITNIKTNKSQTYIVLGRCPTAADLEAQINHFEDNTLVVDLPKNKTLYQIITWTF